MNRPGETQSDIGVEFIPTDTDSSRGEAKAVHREPTAEMIARGLEEGFEDNDAGHSLVRDVWRTMWDAALSPIPQSEAGERVGPNFWRDPDGWAAHKRALSTPTEQTDLTDEQWEAVKAAAPKPKGPLTPITPDGFAQTEGSGLAEELAALVDEVCGSGRVLTPRMQRIVNAMEAAATALERTA